MEGRYYEILLFFTIWTSVCSAKELLELVTFRDINIIVVTDTHSWLASHRHPDHLPQNDLTYGNLTSFVSMMKESAKKQGKDVFFVDNGDNVDGTGLSNASPIDAQEVFPILMKVPFDAMTLGNHEIYFDTTVKEMISSGYIAHWNSSYVTSNVYLASPRQPIGSLYTILTGETSGVRLLVLGMLYDMTDNTEAVFVEPVEDTISSRWFKDALALEDYDAILVLAHMDYSDELITTLLEGMRTVVGPTVPIQFLTGHSHIRAQNYPDKFSCNLEAGNYANTVGFVSFDLQVEGSEAVMRFDHNLYDANVATLAQVLGLSELSDMVTKEGLLLDEEIATVRERMGLLDVIGCSDSHFVLSEDISSETSLYGLYLHQVAPSSLFSPPYNESQLLVTGTGLFRYDLFSGKIMVDDLWTMSPFAQPYIKLDHILGQDLISALTTLNKKDRESSPLSVRNMKDPLFSADNSSLKNYEVSSIPLPTALYDVIATEWDGYYLSEAIATVSGQRAPTLNPYRIDDINCTSLWFSYVESERMGKSCI